MNSNVKQIKFQEFNPPSTDAKSYLNNFILYNKIKTDTLESILSYLATLTKFTYTEGGLINSATYIQDNFTPDAWHIGLYKFLMTPNRGEILFGKSGSGTNAFYCALVPLILAAHKKYNDIPYNNWSTKGLNSLVHKPLLEAMVLKGSAPEFSKDYLVSVRDRTLVYKSGTKAGSARKAQSYFGKVTGLDKVDHLEIKNLTILGQIMLMQVWAAHPDNRNKYMILDLNDWDNMPEPLEDSTLFEAEHPCVTQNNVQKQERLPWDLD